MCCQPALIKQYPEIIQLIQLLNCLSNPYMGSIMLHRKVDCLQIFKELRAKNCLLSWKKEHYWKIYLLIIFAYSFWNKCLLLKTIEKEMILKIFYFLTGGFYYKTVVELSWHPFSWGNVLSFAMETLSYKQEFYWWHVICLIYMWHSDLSSVDTSFNIFKWFQWNIQIRSIFITALFNRLFVVTHHVNDGTNTSLNP